VPRTPKWIRRHSQHPTLSAGGPDGYGSVTVYPSLSSGTGVLNEAPIATILDDTTGNITQLNGPLGIALDSSNAIYVANFAGGPLYQGSVTIYPSLNDSGLGLLKEPPTATIVGAGTNLIYPDGIVLDPNGNIYVTNEGSGNGGLDSVTSYRPDGNGGFTLFSTITGPATGLIFPWGIAIGPR